jgi:hypothetical protein
LELEIRLLSGQTYADVASHCGIDVASRHTSGCFTTSSIRSRRSHT